MATAAQITRVRVHLADQLTWYEDYANGDASGTVFWLSHFPVYADTETVSLGGTVQGTAAYTLTDASGKLVFAAAPPSGTNNVKALYEASVFTDAEVDDFYDEEGQANVLAAAAAGWRAKAGKYATEFDFSSDGSRYERSQQTENCLKMADKYDDLASRQVPTSAGTGGIYAGGISQDDKDTVEDDTDRVEPAFIRGLMRYPGGAGPYDELDDPDA